MTKRVLSVGQCVPDQAALDRYLKSAFSVQVTTAETAAETLHLLQQQSFDLILVNRKLDIDYSDGLDIIRAMKAEPEWRELPVMLITNYPEHQANAVAIGAEPGFGKQELGLSSTTARLQPFLGA